MKKGDILEQVEIQSLGWGGVGIAKAPNGKKILIKGALPNSTVDIKIVQRKRSYLTAHIISVHAVDKKRLDTEVKCPHYFFAYTKDNSIVQDTHKDPKVGCGGCKLQVMSYEKQLELKQDMVEQCFHGIKAEVLPILGTSKPFGYRNKIEFSFGKYLVKKPSPPNPLPPLPKGEEIRGELDSQGNPFAVAEHRQLGFHKQGEFSKVVDIDQCYLVSERMHGVYRYVKKQLSQSGLPVYDAKSHTGVLRHLVIREGVHTGHIMVHLSYASEKLSDKKIRKEAWQALLRTWKKDAFLQEQVTTFVLNENNGLADTVRGQDSRLEVLRGEGKIFEELHIQTTEGRAKNAEDKVSDVGAGISLPEISGESFNKDIVVKFQISPFSFFQTNTWGAEVLFGTAMEMLSEVKGNIIDLYCGSGTIGLTLLKAGVGKAVKGIEIVASAVRDAGENAKINGLYDRAHFYEGKAEKVLYGSDDVSGLKRGTLDEFLIGGDVVIVDPPREGLHPKVVDFLVDLRQQKPFRLLYISCNPTTMARDITGLQEGGYKIGNIQPVDMFPQTHHAECVAVLD